VRSAVSAVLSRQDLGGGHDLNTWALFGVMHPACGRCSTEVFRGGSSDSITEHSRAGVPKQVYSVGLLGVKKEIPVNTIHILNAVLCADCEIISDSAGDTCVVCGSRCLLSLGRVLGGTIGEERAVLLPTNKKKMAQYVYAAGEPRRVLETEPSRSRIGPQPLQSRLISHLPNEAVLPQR